MNSKLDSWIGLVLLTLTTIIGVAALATGIAAYIARDMPKVQGMGLAAGLALIPSAVGWWYWRKERRHGSDKGSGGGSDFPLQSG